MLVLQEISAVCDTAALEEQLNQTDQRVAAMQQSIVGPQSELDHAATVSPSGNVQKFTSYPWRWSVSLWSFLGFTLIRRWMPWR